MSILSGEFANVERVTRTITGLSWLRVPITLRPCCYSLDHKGRSGTNKLDQYSRYTSRSTTLPLAVSICNTNMVNADTAPALPWGASNERDNVQQAGTSSSRLSHSLTTAESEPDHTGTPQVEEAWPSSGSSIEVRWQLEDDNKTETVWWKAMVARIQPAQADQIPHEAPAVLRYQAFRDFEEETADVVFTADGRLYHSDSQDTLLQWRLQGDQHSDSDEEDEGDMVLDANDLNQHEELLERELGISAEDVMRQQLQSYPPDQQRQLASGARDFVDHFRQHLSQLAQASGGNHTVTANDINGIFASLQQR